jgi:hypothetical protein
MKKRRQHHVWQHYLKSWSVNGRVWVLREGKTIFNTDTVNVAVERDFYKVHKLTSRDLDLLRVILSGPKHPAAKKTDEQFLALLMAPAHFVEQNRHRFKNLEKIDVFLDVHMTNFLENYHAGLEANFVKLLARIKRADLSFLSSEPDSILFFYFVSMQYMRTKGIREKSIERVQAQNGHDLSRIWGILSIVFARAIGVSLFVERKQRNLALIKNRTDVPFITGDQPVINLHGQSPEPTQTVSLYYPITPRLAVLLTEVDEQPAFSTEYLTSQHASEFNERIFHASHSQVFSESEASLRPFLKPSTCDPVRLAR